MSLKPLIYTGRIARNIEKGIRRRDENFPSFIRSLGSSAGARGGMVDEAFKALHAHDFVVMVWISGVVAVVTTSGVASLLGTG